MTVAELRQRMSQAELSNWFAYVEENGPVNPMLRFDAAVARAVVPFLKGTKPRDMMPWPKERDMEATPENVMNILRGVKK